MNPGRLNKKITWIETGRVLTIYENESYPVGDVYPETMKLATVQVGTADIQSLTVTDANGICRKPDSGFNEIDFFGLTPPLTFISEWGGPPVTKVVSEISAPSATWVEVAWAGSSGGLSDGFSDSSESVTVICRGDPDSVTSGKRFELSGRRYTVQGDAVPYESFPNPTRLITFTATRDMTHA